VRTHKAQQEKKTKEHPERHMNENSIVLLEPSAPSAPEENDVREYVREDVREDVREVRGTPSSLERNGIENDMNEITIERNDSDLEEDFKRNETNDETNDEHADKDMILVTEDSSTTSTTAQSSKSDYKRHDTSVIAARSLWTEASELIKETKNIKSMNARDHKFHQEHNTKVGLMSNRMSIEKFCNEMNKFFLNLKRLMLNYTHEMSLRDFNNIAAEIFLSHAVIPCMDTQHSDAPLEQQQQPLEQLCSVSERGMTRASFMRSQFDVRQSVVDAMHDALKEEMTNIMCLKKSIIKDLLDKCNNETKYNMDQQNQFMMDIFIIDKIEEQEAHNYKRMMFHIMKNMDACLLSCKKITRNSMNSTRTTLDVVAKKLKEIICKYRMLDLPLDVITCTDHEKKMSGKLWETFISRCPRDVLEDLEENPSYKCFLERIIRGVDVEVTIPITRSNKQALRNMIDVHFTVHDDRYQIVNVNRDLEKKHRLVGSGGSGETMSHLRAMRAMILPRRVESLRMSAVRGYMMFSRRKILLTMLTMFLEKMFMNVK
jgi:hypothetical protein